MTTRDAQNELARLMQAFDDALMALRAGAGNVEDLNATAEAAEAAVDRHLATLGADVDGGRS
jgi:hypothetical protein